MKKIVIFLACVFTISASFGQTTSVTSTTKTVLPTKDTLTATTTKTTAITSRTVYDTSITSVVKYDTLKYKAPVIVTPADSNSFALQPLYKSSLPVSYSNKSNFTISGLTFTGGTYGISLNGCSNVVIAFNRVVGASKYEIYLYNCKNVKVLYNWISGGVSGVHAENSSSIVINHNQIGDIAGPFPGGNFVQFVNVSGPKSSISYNRCEDLPGVGKPEDGLSVYKSNGAPGDSIMLIGNWIRGGQYYNTSGGGAGIVLGDVGGSYQVARYNILVNPGYVGVQVQGGTHIKMDHNIIFSTATPYSNDGMSFGNYSGAPVSDINMSYNKIKFFNRSGSENDAWYDPKAGLVPAGWYTNILKANIDASVLPAVIRTWK